MSSIILKSKQTTKLNIIKMYKVRQKDIHNVLDMTRMDILNISVIDCQRVLSVECKFCLTQLMSSRREVSLQC